MSDGDRGACGSGYCCAANLREARITRTAAGLFATAAIFIRQTDQNANYLLSLYPALWCRFGVHGFGTRDVALTRAQGGEIEKERSNPPPSLQQSDPHKRLIFSNKKMHYFSLDGRQSGSFPE